MTGAGTVVVQGGDADLARAVASAPGAPFRFLADGTSDVARAVGLVPAAAGRAEVVLDALRVAGAGPAVAVNAVVLGAPPGGLGRFARAVPLVVEVDGRPVGEGPATTVVIATGQFLRGADVVPRGHPGDGRIEVQVYRLRPGERAAMRSRLRLGEHLPHPRIVQRSGRRVAVRAVRPLPVEVDGAAVGRAASLDVEVVPGAYRLLV